MPIPGPGLVRELADPDATTLRAVPLNEEHATPWAVRPYGASDALVRAASAGKYPAELHGLAPPDGWLIAEEVGFGAPRKMEIEHLPRLKCGAGWPTAIFVEMRFSLVDIHQSDLLRRAGDHVNCVQPEVCARQRLRRNIIGNLGEHQNECEDCCKDGDFLHRGNLPLGKLCH